MILSYVTLIKQIPNHLTIPQFLIILTTHISMSHSHNPFHDDLDITTKSTLFRSMANRDHLFKNSDTLLNPENRGRYRIVAAHEEEFFL